MNRERTTEMSRDTLLYKICPWDRINGCCNGTRDYQCYDCAQLVGKWLDEYDKQIRAKAIDDFVKACENNQLFPMYGGYVYMTDIKEIAEKLKAGVKNEN